MPKSLALSAARLAMNMAIVGSALRRLCLVIIPPDIRHIVLPAKSVICTKVLFCEVYMYAIAARSSLTSSGFISSTIVVLTFDFASADSEEVSLTLVSSFTSCFFILLPPLPQLLAYREQFLFSLHPRRPLSCSLLKCRQYN